MRSLGIILIVVAIILFAANWYIERQRRAAGDDVPTRRRRAGRPKPSGFDTQPDFARPRPDASDFHVQGDEARVTFEVPFPDEGDEVLADLLVSEAIEVVREKRHSLPINDVTEVVVFVGDGNPREVGRTSLVTPGVLPPPSRITDILNLHSIGADPLAAEFENGPSVLPETVAPSRSDELAPLGEMLRLPKAVLTGLRAQGIDPEKMTGGELVTGVLGLFGYAVTPGLAEGTYTATKGGSTTFIMTDSHTEGEYPEVEEDTIRRFVIAFGQVPADRGMFVSEKFGPFSIYEHEKRDPRMRFITRERLQKFVDSMALG